MAPIPSTASEALCDLVFIYRVRSGDRDSQQKRQPFIVMRTMVTIDSALNQGSFLLLFVGPNNAIMVPPATFIPLGRYAGWPHKCCVHSALVSLPTEWPNGRDHHLESPLLGKPVRQY